MGCINRHEIDPLNILIFEICIKNEMKVDFCELHQSPQGSVPGFFDDDSIDLLPDNEGYRSKDNTPGKQVEFRTGINGTMAVPTVAPDTKCKTLFITSTRIEKRKDEHL
jgi:hypothetical protein